MVRHAQMDHLAGELVQLLTDAETGQRGFIITQRPSYLEPYRSSVAMIDSRLATLRKLTVDDGPVVVTGATGGGGLAAAAADDRVAAVLRQQGDGAGRAKALVGDLLMAAAGHQAEAALDEVIEKYKGQYILAVEGNPPLNEDGMYCVVGGRPFLEQLKECAADAKAVIAWGACASWGCVQAAKPNPTQAVPIHKVITDKPIIKVPGCPPIAEVMTAVVTYMLTFDRIPELDRLGRPKMFYGQRIHDKCYRRPHFDAGQFVEHWDDEGARRGYCLYKVGCKGPTTYNACSTTRWNGGVSFPIGSGHGCIGCSEEGFWDKGSFYDRLTGINAFGIEANADKVGGAAAGAVGAAVAAHAAVSAIKRATAKQGS